MTANNAVGEVTVLRHDPDTFFRDRSGLWVYGFRSTVVAKAKPSQSGASLNAKVTELTRNLTDAEIEAGLSDHLWSETDVCAFIAHHIALQEGGKEGKLLNNGVANLFYLASCVVDVSWGAGRGEWRVFARERGDGGWFAGSRMFSPRN